MDIKDQIRITEELLEGVKELNGEYQEGWENNILEAESLLKHLKQVKNNDLLHSVSDLLFRAEKVYGNKYDRFSIQIEEGEAHLIGHEEIPYEADWEHKLCNVSELLNGL